MFYIFFVLLFVVILLIKFCFNLIKGYVDGIYFEEVCYIIKDYMIVLMVYKKYYERFNKFYLINWFFFCVYIVEYS